MRAAQPTQARGHYAQVENLGLSPITVTSLLKRGIKSLFPIQKVGAVGARRGGGSEERLHARIPLLHTPT